MNTLSTLAEVQTSCQHTPPCEPWYSPGHSTARVKYDHHRDCGCVVLCNDVTVFDDTSELLPDGTTVAAHRAEPKHRLASAS